MCIVHQPHDRFFKVSFGDRDVVESFLEVFLPKAVLDIMDVGALEPLKESFVEEDLRESFSDLLFGVRLNQEEGYLYFLFEHKSFADDAVLFQLLRYMTEIWRAKWKNEGARRIPVVFPLVIYHGASTWNVETELAALIPRFAGLPEEVRRSVPNFEYRVLDLSTFDDTHLQMNAKLNITLNMLKYSRVKDLGAFIVAYQQAVKRLMELERDSSRTEFFEALLRYVFSVRQDLSREEVLDVTAEASVEGREFAMTIMEELWKEGMEEGVEKGIEKGRKDVAKKMLESNMDLKQIMEWTELSEDEINEVKKEMH